MPRDVDQFVAWRLLWYCFQKLQGIQQAAGYNNDAEVYLDAEGYRNSSARCALLIYSDGESIDDSFMGGGGGGPRVDTSTNVTINGSFRYGVDSPARCAMSLEQDVRTALQTAVTAARPIVAAGFRSAGTHASGS